MKIQFNASILKKLAGLLAFISLAGCSSMRVLSSTPPVKSIVLETPAAFHYGLVGGKISLPAGEYKPAMESDAGYFYAAPAKLVTRDLFSEVADGGFFIKRGEKAPSRWYLIDPQGVTHTWILPDSVHTKIVE